MAEDKGKKEEEKKPAEGADAEAAAAATAKAKKKKKMIIIGAVVVVAIIGGVLASGVLGGKEESAEHAKAGEHGADGKLHPDKDPCLEPASGGGKKEEKTVDPCKPIYLEVPDLIVNLSSQSNRPHFANLKITLELKPGSNGEEVNADMPRIVDSFNTYMREMTKEDLEGSEGLIRLEDEMMLRLNKILKPGTVTDILYRSVIVQ